MRKAFIAMLLAATLVLPAMAKSDDRADDFVTANALAILYHELGHALIDILGLPVFGQEEDAADVLSVLLIHQLYDDGDATDIIYDAAFGFLREAEEHEPALWGVHGPDLQRYYTMICLFYGADPDARHDLAEELDLPEERRDTCSDEFELAEASWGPVLDEIAAEAPGESLVFTGDATSLLGAVLAEEVAALNADFVLPESVHLSVQDCDEANGFYDSETREIILCSELDGYLRALSDF
ncbi:DUF4344 domain-containing metallopeptidase [Roseobacter denitrificans]|nr:DUF4344 domain-containing metallopeptidase [Roseobacter denitrificans]